MKESLDVVFSCETWSLNKKSKNKKNKIKIKLKCNNNSYYCYKTKITTIIIFSMYKTNKLLKKTILSSK